MQRRDDGCEMEGDPHRKLFDAEEDRLGSSWSCGCGILDGADEDLEEF